MHGFHTAQWILYLSWLLHVRLRGCDTSTSLSYKQCSFFSNVSLPWYGAGMQWWDTWHLTSAGRVESVLPHHWSWQRTCGVGPRSTCFLWGLSSSWVWRKGVPTWCPGAVSYWTNGGPWPLNSKYVIPLGILHFRYILRSSSLLITTENGIFLVKATLWCKEKTEPYFNTVSSKFFQIKHPRHTINFISHQNRKITYQLNISLW